ACLRSCRRRPSGGNPPACTTIHRHTHSAATTRASCQKRPRGCIVVQEVIPWRFVMRKVETSVRFSPGTLERLRLMAHLKSIESGKTVTGNALVGECVEKHLLGVEPRPHAERPLATAGR